MAQAQRQWAPRVTVRTAKSATTGTLGECVEAWLGKYRVGYIQFVRRGPLLEIIGGSVEAPDVRRGQDTEQDTEQDDASSEPTGGTSIEDRQTKVTKLLLGASGNVRFGAATVIILDDTREVARGDSWEQAFQRAATLAGVWQSAVARLCRQQKREAFVSVGRLTRLGASTLSDTAKREQLQFEDSQGKLSEPIDAFTLGA